jgi:hypothetical protein
VTGRSFADLLDDALGSVEVREPRAAERPLNPAPPHPFLFFRISSAADMVATPQLAAAQSNPLGAAARGTRLLTSAERRALDLLVGLGARLMPEFALDELRREYRRLALRVHPDRHPTANADERAGLAQAFASATDAYRLLSAIAIAH